jgi:SAM-dependent methyltransferase
MAMANADKLFTGNIPEIYERLLVPLLFEPYAQDLAGKVAGARPRDVLEVAAGTGALTRALAGRLAADARIVASDLNVPMLERAQASLAQDPRVTWRQADALDLPFDAEAFDVVVCQFGVMFYPDKAQGHREARRVLRPGGRYFFAVWDALGNNAFAGAVEDALSAIFADRPPRFMSRIPHGYCDPDTLRADLRAAGMGAIEIEAVQHISKAASVRAVAEAFCCGTPLRAEIEARSPGGVSRVTDEVTQALLPRFGAGHVEGRIAAYLVTCAR